MSSPITNNCFFYSFERGAPFGPGYLFSNFSTKYQDLKDEKCSKMIHELEHKKTDYCQGNWNEGENNCREDFLSKRVLHRDKRSENQLKLDGLESTFVQFYSLACFPDSKYLFSNYHAGHNSLMLKNSQSKVDFSFTLDVNDKETKQPVVLCMLNLHGSKFHRVEGSSHNYYCNVLNKKYLNRLANEFAMDILNVITKSFKIQDKFDTAQNLTCFEKFLSSLTNDRKEIARFQKIFCQAGNSVLKEDAKYYHDNLEGRNIVDVINVWKERLNIFFEEFLSFYDSDDYFNEWQDLHNCIEKKEERCHKMLYTEFKKFKKLFLFLLPSDMLPIDFEEYLSSISFVIREFNSRLTIWSGSKSHFNILMRGCVFCVTKAWKRYKEIRKNITEEFLLSRNMTLSMFNSNLDGALELDSLDYNFDTRFLDDFRLRVSKVLTKVWPEKLIFFYHVVSECNIIDTLGNVPKPQVSRRFLLDRLQNFMKSCKVHNKPLQEILHFKTRQLIKEEKIIMPKGIHTSVKEYISRCYPESSLLNEVPGKIFDREKITQGELLKLLRSNVPNMLDRNKSAPYIGFISFEGGNEKETMYLSGLPSQSFGNCHSKSTLDYEKDVGDFTKFQVSKHLGEENDNSIKSFLSGKYLKKDRSLMRRSFPKDRCSTVSFNYMAYLLKHRGLSGIRIQHVLIYRCKNYLTPMIRTMLNERWTIRGDKSKKLLNTCYKLFLNSGKYIERAIMIFCYIH